MTNINLMHHFFSELWRVSKAKHPKQIAKYFSTRRIIAAVMIGLLVSLYLIFRDFELKKYEDIKWGYTLILYLIGAIILMIIRDLAYIYRLRVLTGKKIGWKNGFQVIMLWEFASALTPSVVGGSAAALYIVSKECSSIGKSTAIVMITALLDEAFYIVMVPLLFIFISANQLFIHGNFQFFGMGEIPTQFIFIIGYLFILVLTTIITLAIFLKPIYFKLVLEKIFSLRFLKKWKAKASNTGNEIILTSQEMKGKPIMFWIKAFGATMFSWTARFWVVNFLILAFVSGGDQLLIYARQLVMWVILLISPTPGGSGIAEFMLPNFIGEYMGGFSNEITLLWRLISYYAYLIIGAIVLPVWLRRVYKK